MVTPSYHPSVDGFFTINQPFWGTPMTYGHRDEAISPSAQVGGWVSNKKKLMGSLQMFPMASLEQFGCNRKKSNTKK